MCDEYDDGLPDEYDDYEGADMTKDLNEWEEVFRVPDMSGQDDIDIKDIMMRGDIDEHIGHVTPEYYESGTMSKTAEEDSAPDELPSKSYNGE